MPIEFSDRTEMAIGAFNLDQMRHAGISFVDGLTGYTHDIELNLTAEDIENPDYIAGSLIISDDAGQFEQPLDIVIPERRVFESKKIVMYAKEHKKSIVGTAAITAIVAVGTLVLRHRHHP